MSLQPIITSAFSTYAMGRGLYADRASYGNRANETQQSLSPEALGTAGTTGISGPGGAIDPIAAAQRTRIERTDKDAEKVKSPSGDILDLSPGALDQAAAMANSADKSETVSKSSSSASDSALNADQTTASTVDSSGKTDTLQSTEQKLTAEEQEQVRELRARDAEVRAHEQAHMAAAGPYAQGGPSYTYQTGPDGRRYAIGGEVSIDASPISGDPEATIAKMQQIRGAALAPAQPSSQDYKVASAASQQEAAARMQLAEERRAETSGASTEDPRGLATENSTVQSSENAPLHQSALKKSVGADSRQTDVQTGPHSGIHDLSQGNMGLSGQINGLNQKENAQNLSALNAARNNSPSVFYKSERLQPNESGSASAQYLAQSRLASNAAIQSLNSVSSGRFGIYA